MSEIKLIAIDLDDTLLRNDLTISPRAKNAIQRAVEKGTAVTLATGRMFRSALPFALELGLDLPLITYQGALVKYADGKEVYNRPLRIDTTMELLRFIKPYQYHINLYINDELYMENDSPEGQRYLKIARVPVHFVDNLEENTKSEPSKIVIIAQPHDLERLHKDLDGTFADKVNITRSKPHFLEISHLEATKGQALQRLAESRNLTAQQVMAIGDSMNDLDMIQYAGFGVAMENALPEIKKYARYVTKHNDDDGVAEIIEQHVLGSDYR